MITPIIAKTNVNKIPNSTAERVSPCSVFTIPKSAAKPPNTIIVYVDLLKSKKYFTNVSLPNFCFSLSSLASHIIYILQAKLRKNSTTCK